LSHCFSERSSPVARKIEMKKGDITIKERVEVLYGSLCRSAIG